MFKSYIYILLFLAGGFTLQASKISKAYKALSIYNYFEAKRLFEKTIKKKQPEASFGLATIYFRTDNPFSNSDSAAKFIIKCKTSFNDTVSYSGYHINGNSIYKLSQQIATRGFAIYQHKNSVSDYNLFLKRYFFANDSIKQLCYQYRDSLDFDNYKFYDSSDSIQTFIHKYPNSVYNIKARIWFDDLLFSEQVPTNTLAQLKQFIKNYPNNPHFLEAEKSLYEQTILLHNADSLHVFITKYSTAQTNEQAWKALYSLSVKDFSKEGLTSFSLKYTDYPYANFLEKEISLSQELLLPITSKKNKIGYIDTLGIWKIKPQYDDANFFSEGYASVCRHDSCFYITKDGIQISSYVFNEAEDYKQGVAVVQKDKLFYLINRSAQFISKGYVELSKQSDNLYVCKFNELYGAINNKGEVVIPFNYSKLGDFKNNYAYYVSNKYGLINTSNRTLKAEWDWISDVDTNSIAIIKKENVFGLLRSNGELVLKPQFDYIEACKNGLYLVVKNNLYGFYNSKEFCYVTNIEFDYNKTMKADEYSNGKYFKLFKNNESALVDANGRYSINFGTYTNLFFSKCDIIRVQKNNKYGFVDRKLKSITAIEYDNATDFENDLAIANKGTKAMLINKDGKVIYLNKEGEIEKLNAELFLLNSNELQGVIQSNGNPLLLPEYESIELITSHFYHCIKPDGSSYLWNAFTKKLTKL